jgi:Phosphotransferase enzyme family
VEKEVLTGGNTHAEVVRIGDTVRRPTGASTPGVHALLAHLEQRGFEGAPRAHGIDERGREVLDYVEGEVVYPDHLDHIASDAALAEVASVIRRFHDAASSFAGSRAYVWSDRGSDPAGPKEILCHNDLAPWNLVRTGEGRWVFIDWDLAAPGRRAWDLAWALLSFVPLMPDSDLDDVRMRERIAVVRSAYGIEAFPADVLSVAVERCQREADLIYRLGAAGELPYARLLAEGHARTWSEAATYVASRLLRWSSS